MAAGKSTRTYPLTLTRPKALLTIGNRTILEHQLDALGGIVDGVVLVAMSGKTTGPQLNRAREICLGLDANILGLVVGNLQEAMPEYAEAGYD